MPDTSAPELLYCPLCGNLPGTKVGPPAMARSITKGCDGTNLAAVTLAEWNTRSPAARSAPELLALAEELREFTAIKYMGDCKCGKCQLVPRDLIDRIYTALRSPVSGVHDVREATIEQCAKIADDWLKIFGDREIQYTTAREYASDAVADIAENIRALANPAGKQGEDAWRTIDTAPKDGTIILLGNIGSEPRPAYWGLAPSTSGAGANQRFPWTFLDNTNGVNHMSDGEFGPTHWQPLPTPPVLP